MEQIYTMGPPRYIFRTDLHLPATTARVLEVQGAVHRRTLIAVRYTADPQRDRIPSIWQPQRLGRNKG